MTVSFVNWLIYNRILSTTMTTCDVKIRFNGHLSRQALYLYVKICTYVSIYIYIYRILFPASNINTHIHTYITYKSSFLACLFGWLTSFWCCCCRCVASRCVALRFYVIAWQPCGDNFQLNVFIGSDVVVAIVIAVLRLNAFHKHI